MNEHLRDRIARKIETLTDEKGYQVLDFVEFLESKYATKPENAASIFTRFADTVEDTLRAGKVSANVISETMGFMGKAMGVLNGAVAAGKSVATDISGTVNRVGSNASAAASAAVAAANAAATGSQKPPAAPTVTATVATNGAPAPTAEAPPIAKPDPAVAESIAVDAHWPTDGSAPRTGN
jgi:hypothetical protein